MTVAGAAIAAIASFAAAPVANADTSGGGNAPALHAPMQHHASQSHHVSRHPAKPAVQRRSTAPIYKFVRPARVTKPTRTIVRPARPGQPAVAARPAVRLWHGTPSYTVSPHRTGSPAVTGIGASCKKSGNQSGTWFSTSAHCPNGYEVTGDVTVPVTKTLTIKANTTVYFDTTVQGSLGAAGTDASTLPDLIVDGTLTVAGTSAGPVTLTSANAGPGSSTDPLAGDWGYVVFNHTGANKGAGSMNHMRLLYGEGLVADRVAPALTNSSISIVAAGTNSITKAGSIDTNAGIDYVNLPAGSVTMSHLTFDGGDVAGVTIASDYAQANFGGGTGPGGHALTLNLTNSSLTGGGADTVLVDTESNGASTATNAPSVKLNVHGNHITQTGSSYELDVEAYSHATTVAGTAAITGALDNNVMNGGSSSYGVYLYSQADQTKATGISACDGDSVCIMVPFTRNHISADNTVVENYVQTNGSGAGNSRISTPIGKTVTHKHKKPTIVAGGVYQSSASDVWENYNYNYGAGDAHSSLPSVKTTFSAYSYGQYIDQDAYQGAAGLSASMASSKVFTSDNDGVYVSNLATDNSKHSGSSGKAATTIAYTNDVMNSYSATLEGYTESDRGAATSKVTYKNLTANTDDYGPYMYVYSAKEAGSGAASNTLTVTGSDITAYYSALWAFTEGDYGTSPAHAVVKATSSTLTSYDDDTVYSDLYGSQQAGSHGSATQSVVVNKCDVTGYNAGIYAYTESGRGAASSSPQVLSSTVTSADDDIIDNEVYSANDGGSGAATGSPVIKGSKAHAYDYGVYNYIYANYGSGLATGNPVISGSTVSSYSDDLLYNYVYGTDQPSATGSAKGSPVITGSNVSTDYYVIDNSVQGYTGSATGNPAIKSSHAESGDDYGIYNDVEAGGTSGTGAATGNPMVSSSKLHTYDYGVYNQIYSYGGAATGNPVISKSLVNAADDDLLYNDVEASKTTGPGTATASPHISGSTLHSYYYLVDNYAYAYHGAATGSPVISSSTGVSDGDYGVYNTVYADYANTTGNHTATGNAAIKGSTVSSYYGAIYQYVYGYRGDAVGNPSFSGSTIAAFDDYALYNEVESDYGGSTTGHTATANAHLTKSQVHAYDEALYQDVYGNYGPAVANPVITGSTLTANFDDAIENNVYGSYSGGTGSATANPLVSNSSIYAYDDGLYNYATGYRGKAVASPTVTGSKIKSYFDYGVDNEAYGSYIAGSSGTAGARPTLTNDQILIGDGSYGLYNYANSKSGNATAEPTITTVHVDSPDGYGFYNYAYAAQDSAGEGTATAHPVITGSSYGGYYEGLYNYADSSYGNSPADASFTVKSSTLKSTDDTAIDSEAYSAGSGLSKNNPTISGSKLRSPDDDVVNLYAEPAGTGSAHVGGTVTNSSLYGYGDDVYVIATGSGSGSSLFNTVFTSDRMRAAEADGVDASYGSNGGSNTISPTFNGGSIYAPDDYAVDLEAYGSGTGTSDARTVAPVVKGATWSSYYGTYLYAYDSLGSASPGSVRVGGSFTGSSLTATDDYGVYAEAACNYCQNGSLMNPTFSNTPISSYNEALYLFSQVTANGAGMARLGGSAKSTHGDLLTDQTSDAVYAGAYQYGTGDARSSFTLSGLHLAGNGNAVDHDVYANSGNAINNSVITGNVVTNQASSGSEDGIYDYTQANGGTGIAVRNGSISRNTISDMTGSGSGIAGYIYGATEERPTLTIAHNKITNVGDYGIYVTSNANSLSTSYNVTVDHNTINRTGGPGVYLDGVKAIVTGNRISNVGLSYTGSPNQAGLFVNDTPFRGSVTCNVIWSNAFGIEYGNSNSSSDPATHNNSFRSLTSSVRNSTDIRTAGTGNTDASSNFWGGTPRVTATGVGGTIDTTPRLSSIPNCAKTAGA